MSLAERIFEYILVNQRWFFVVFFLLPLSTAYDAFYYLRCKLVFALFSNPKRHDERVKEVQRQVRQWASKEDGKQMCTARPGWQTMSFRQGKYKHDLNRIKINLMDVLDIDTVKKTVRVEPLVTMGQLSSILVSKGWTLPIVPELDDLTVGGMVNGTGVETSSQKYGLFQNICEAYEIVLADGSLVKCSKEENSDLFYAIPWSHGTLGFVVAAELRIIPATKYVHVRYIPVKTSEAITETFSREVKNSENDFVEGLMFSRDEAVIMTGKMTDNCEKHKLNEIGLFHKPWFFTYVRSFLKKGESVEFIPVRDYYHRHSKSLFWEIEDIIPFGNNVIFRWLFGWMIPPKISLLKLTQTETVRKFYEKYQFIQDMLVPMDSMHDSLTFLHENITIYPLWLCPFLIFTEPGFVHTNTAEPEMYVDIGLYGLPKISNYDPEKNTRQVEAFVREKRGYQMLYGDTYQTKEEFRQMFDHSHYDRVRKQLNCEKAFPEVYDKISKNARY